MAMQTKKYLMFISYIGPGFRGSQIQSRNKKDDKESLKTVQGVIERELSHIFQFGRESERPMSIKLCSRTDKGVHALKAALLAFLPKYRRDFLKPNDLVGKLNLYLSKSENVRVLEAHIIPDSVTFRDFIKDKTYLYRVGLLKKEFYESNYRNVTPITEIERTYFPRLHVPFDLKKAQKAAQLFEGTKDFTAVMGRPKSNIRPTICNIMSYSVQESQPLFPLDPLCERFHFYHFICKGDRFLYHMVRRMVTLTLGVGFNYLGLEDIQKLFDKPLPSSWPKKQSDLVPGYGLYLIDMRVDLEKIQKKEMNGETNSEIHLDMNLSKELTEAST